MSLYKIDSYSTCRATTARINSALVFLIILYAFFSLYTMTDKNRKSKQFITNWPSSHAPKYASNESTRTASIHEETLDHVSTNELQQGELYILKIKLIAIALFQGKFKQMLYMIDD